MTTIYKSDEGARAVRERYLEILKRWPVPNEQMRVPTRQGETFVIACGEKTAMPLLLFHGSAGNSAMWMGDVRAWAGHYRVYSIDLIGEAGMSAPTRPPLASEEYALWLDDVLKVLSITKAAIVGVSLGGWLALDYSTRRPERVTSLALISPGGVGHQKIGIIFKTIALRACGSWGTRRAREAVLGRRPPATSPAARYFMEFLSLIHENFRPRIVELPIFSDEALHRLTMPVMAVLGGKDVLLDSAGTKRRLEHNMPQADIRYLPEAGHFISGQTAPILDFLGQSPVVPQSS
jgi:pimeloyl-ACP methyl ester carboxylesterase